MGTAGPTPGVAAAAASPSFGARREDLGAVGKHDGELLLLFSASGGRSLCLWLFRAGSDLPPLLPAASFEWSDPWAVPGASPALAEPDAFQTLAPMGLMPLRSNTGDARSISSFSLLADDASLSGERVGAFATPLGREPPNYGLDDDQAEGKHLSYADDTKPPSLQGAWGANETPAIGDLAIGGAGAVPQLSKSPKGCSLVLVGVGHQFCLGRIGAKGKFCLKPASLCEVANHRTIKASIDEGTYVLATDQAQGLLAPSFEALAVEGNPIWERFKGGRYLPADWAHIQQLILGPDEAEAIVLKAKVVPTSAKRKLVPSDLSKSPGADPVSWASDLASNIQEAFRAVEDTTQQMREDLLELSRRVGQADDEEEEGVSAFWLIKSVSDGLGELGSWTKLLDRRTREEMHLRMGLEDQVASTQNRLVEAEAKAVRADFNADCALRQAKAAKKQVSLTGTVGLNSKFNHLDTSVQSLQTQLTASKAEVDVGCMRW